MRHLTHTLSIALSAFCSLFLACSIQGTNPALALEQGDECERDRECRGGLVCARSGTCEPFGGDGTAGGGDDCIADADCRNNLSCVWPGRCGSQVPRGAGQRCFQTSNCETGLVCNRENICREPGEEGTIQAGDDCTRTLECGAGLACGPDGVCSTTELWPGVDCEERDPEARPTVFFDLPGAVDSQDFFSLPYPNDARVTRGVINLAGFPGGSSDAPSSDLVNLYGSAVRLDNRGFGLNESIFFRFNQAVDYASLDFGGPGAGFRFVNLTEGTDAFGSTPRSEYYATAGRGQYICQDWLAIRPSEGSPLRSLNTYGAVMFRGLLDTNGVPFEASDDLKLLLNDVPPLNPDVRAAWEAMNPLRVWLASEQIDPDEVIGATVFTTGAFRTRAENTRGAIRVGSEPYIDDVTRCDGEARSPCDGGVDRSCGRVQTDYTEFHGRVWMDSFLSGAAPFDQSGGAINYRNSRPQVVKREAVCVAITIPTGNPPAGGWPVAVFSHDIGGHFRSAITSGLAGQLAQAGWAVVGFDNVLHGARFGSNSDPTIDELTERLMNIRRPDLLRDQAAQGAADLYSLTWLLELGGLQDLDARAPLSTSQLAFVGHGLGAEYGVQFLAYEPAILGAVLGGAGGGMVDMLRLTRSPRNFASELELALSEYELDRYSFTVHPVLRLMQVWLDPRDPQNYGGLLRRPPADVPFKHVFYVYGAGDSDVPKETRNALVVSMRLPLVGDILEELDAVDRVPSEALPLQANVRGRVTQGLKQYPVDSGSAHNAMLTNGRARRDIVSFLRGLVSEESGGVPTISPGLR